MNKEFNNYSDGRPPNKSFIQILFTDGTILKGQEINGVTKFNKYLTKPQIADLHKNVLKWRFVKYISPSKFVNPKKPKQS